MVVIINVSSNTITTSFISIYLIQYIHRVEVVHSTSFDLIDHRGILNLFWYMSFALLLSTCKFSLVSLYCCAFGTRTLERLGNISAWIGPYSIRSPSTVKWPWAPELAIGSMRNAVTGIISMC